MVAISAVLATLFSESSKALVDAALVALATGLDLSLCNLCTWRQPPFSRLEDLVEDSEEDSVGKRAKVSKAEIQLKKASAAAKAVTKVCSVQRVTTT